MDVPVFYLQQGRSVLKPAKIGFKNCLSYVFTKIFKAHSSFFARFGDQLMRDIETKSFGLFDQMGQKNTEPEIPKGPVISLMNFLNQRPEVIDSSQFVEVIFYIIISNLNYQIFNKVVVLGSYVNIRQEDKGFCKIFVAAK